MEVFRALENKAIYLSAPAGGGADVVGLSERDPEQHVDLVLEVPGRHGGLRRRRRTTTTRRPRTSPLWVTQATTGTRLHADPGVDVERDLPAGSRPIRRRPCRWSSGPDGQSYPVFIYIIMVQPNASSSGYVKQVTVVVRDPRNTASILARESLALRSERRTVGAPQPNAAAWLQSSRGRPRADYLRATAAQPGRRGPRCVVGRACVSRRVVDVEAVVPRRGAPAATVPCGSSVERVARAVGGVHERDRLVDLQLDRRRAARVRAAGDGDLRVVAVSETSWNTGFAAGKFDAACDRLARCRSPRSPPRSAPARAERRRGRSLRRLASSCRAGAARGRRAAGLDAARRARAARVERILALEERERLQLAGIGGRPAPRRQLRRRSACRRGRRVRRSAAPARRRRSGRAAGVAAASERRRASVVAAATCGFAAGRCRSAPSSCAPRTPSRARARRRVRSRSSSAFPPSPWPRRRRFCVPRLLLSCRLVPRGVGRRLDVVSVVSSCSSMCRSCRGAGAAAAARRLRGGAEGECVEGDARVERPPVPVGVRPTESIENSRPETSSAPLRTETRLRSRYSRSVSE